MRLGDYARNVNVGDTERLASAVGGALLALWGLRRARLGGLAVAAVGGGLLHRGLTGHCTLYAALGIDRAQGRGRAREGNLGVKIDRSVTVHAPPERLYAFWRDVQNLPRIMSHVERVDVLSETRSRWTVKAPAGAHVSWEAEIINDVPFELIAWRSIAMGSVDHAGSVRFRPAPDGRGTAVDVSLQYDPPGGELGHAVAALLGEDAGRQIEQDLQNFRRAMESQAA